MQATPLVTKAVLCGSPRTTSGVGVIVSERFRDSIVSVERFNDRLMKIVVAAERLCHFLFAYAQQSGCSDQAKQELWSLLDEKTAEVPPKDVIIVAADLNGHVGAAKDGYSCHGGFGYGSSNADGSEEGDPAETLTTNKAVCQPREELSNSTDRFYHAEVQGESNVATATFFSSYTQH
ncbi:unnamed protein product [Heligmosomoides polygyrus]|uniref:Endo/exonuclease/phosphatase domain-containing protein n=1 Tax=Heligmosomoides polygyrus TaxID=6339 RepID=A0A183GW31_HELPZ|nr:unnamed protein product [Heligmosomoides polygyrus]